MKISEKAKRIWKYIGYAVLAIIAITAIAVVWNKRLERLARQITIRLL